MSRIADIGLMLLGIEVFLAHAFVLGAVLFTVIKLMATKAEERRDG